MPFGITSCLLLWLWNFYVSGMGEFSLPAFQFIDVVVNLPVWCFSQNFSVFGAGMTVLSSIKSRGDGDSVWRDWHLVLGINATVLEEPEKGSLGKDSQYRGATWYHWELSWVRLIHKPRWCVRLGCGYHELLAASLIGPTAFFEWQFGEINEKCQPSSLGTIPKAKTKVVTSITGKWSRRWPWVQTPKNFQKSWGRYWTSYKIWGKVWVSFIYNSRGDPDNL